ncbi:AAA family ATPase [Hydrogenophaga sp.]|uniref:ExeA family protein n=1 Tax=Hydrogenophaga sp. TaxID=1904254 RepID=UPI002629BED1|nr:AAA family ATPase [Hydrogenophaga sp.]MCW5652214.1 AAA family ATPase [Hydrogenophaga sp.]
MYAEYFGLKQDPFSIAPDPRYLFMSERHREALAHLLYGIRGGGGFVLLSGEIGAGKTTICRCFLEQIPEQCRVAYIFNPKLTVGDLLKTICREFHVEVRHEGIGPATIKDYLDPLNDYLLQSHARGERNVLIIDEAQNLTPHVLEQLRLLTNLETSERKLLQIILIGQPELRNVLARPELEQLAQRVVARFHLGTLDEAETRQYIQHRLQVAGLRGPLPFSTQALQRIHELTRGVPRRINLLCDRALLGAYATHQARVERAVVDKAAQEVFETDAPASPQRRRRAAAQAKARATSLGMLGAGLLAGAVLAGAAFWLWQRNTPRPVAAQPAAERPTAAVPAAVTPAAPASAPVATASSTEAPPPVDGAAASPPPPGPPPLGALHANENAAWRELGPLWGQALEGESPCASAQREGLQCYRTDRMTLHGMRQLDRPGILTLRLPGQGSGLVLVTALNGETATLQSRGERWLMPLSALADIWRGDFATLWRTPPGQTGRLVDGRSGAAGDWLGSRIAGLQAIGKVPATANNLTARIQAFQRANGIDAAGLAGPITFMQVNLASGVDEPRLSHPGS